MQKKGGNTMSYYDDDNSEYEVYNPRGISPRNFGKLSRYSEEQQIEMLEDMIDMRNNAIKTSKAMAAQLRISEMAAQAGKEMPSEREKFQAIADKHFRRLLEILDRE